MTIESAQSPTTRKPSGRGLALGWTPGDVLAGSLIATRDLTTYELHDVGTG